MDIATAKAESTTRTGLPPSHPPSPPLVWERVARFSLIFVGSLHSHGVTIKNTNTIRSIDLCCIQEMRWRRTSMRMVTGKEISDGTAIRKVNREMTG